MSRLVFQDATAAALLVRDGDTVAISGNGAGMTSAEAIFEALERRFLETGHPRDLTLVHSLGIGDRAERGANRFAHEGMVKRVIAAHFSWSVRMQEMVRDQKVEAYCFPGGVIQHLLREIGAGRPGLFTHSGLGTFIDPRFDGGRCNARSKDSLVELMIVDGKEVLHYRPFKVDVAIVRGTLADRRGNISMESEAVDLDVQTIALAAHNTGGKVLVQVRNVVEAGSLRPRSVRIPGIFVDSVTEEPAQTLFYESPYDETISGERRARMGKLAVELPLKTERRIIARRAAEELRPGLSLNFGFGIPGGIFGVIAEQDLSEDLWMSVEQGVHNGRMLDDHLFGAARNPEVVLPTVEQFDYYSGGGIDIAFLGMGEMDAEGNVNVSHLNGHLVGPGGFIEISQGAKKVVFCGTFDAQGGKVSWQDGRLRVDKAGAVRKLVRNVHRITFSAKYATLRGQTVLYVTERAVFELCPDGVRLVEIAPGIDIGRDILAHMDFHPVIGEVRLMDPAVFL